MISVIPPAKERSAIAMKTFQCQAPLSVPSIAQSVKRLTPRLPGIGPSHGCGTNVIFLILSCTFSALHR